MSKSVFYLIIFFIIIFSFSFHSALFSPILNSDNGVVILMIYNFRLPDDLYFWGQDRFGSLIPLIGQIFYKGLRFSPIVSESISHYLLLILGFFGFADLFKSNFSKISFAIVWFLPPLRMVDLLSGTLGEQYALIGVAVFLINKLYPVKNEIYSFRQYLFLSLIALVFIACIWVSDLACSTIFILLTVHTIFLFKNSKPNYSKIFKRPEIYYIIIGIITAVFFISYAKGNATSLKNYDSFSLNVFVDSIAVFKTTIVDLILFKSQEPLTSIYLYFILAFIIYIVYRHRNISYSNNNLKWITIFVLDIIVVFVILLSSKWSLLNGVPRRYFVGNYISFWIVFFLVLESIHLSMNIQFFKILILFTLIIGGLGTLYNFKYVWPKTLKPKIKIVEEFSQLGKIGIIADYWNSYVTSCSNPDLIKVTPNDKSYVRNLKLVDEVFEQNKLYIVRDLWMDTFPDTLNQFGRILLKDSIPFRLGDCDVCKYKKMEILSHSFTR